MHSPSRRTWAKFGFTLLAMFGLCELPGRWTLGITVVAMYMLGAIEGFRLGKEDPSSLKREA